VEAESANRQVLGVMKRVEEGGLKKCALSVYSLMASSVKFKYQKLLSFVHGMVLTEIAGTTGGFT
jgi:hypothetical protein